MDNSLPDPELLRTALARASPDDIAALLSQAHAASPELLQQLQALTERAEPPGDRLVAPTMAPTVDAPAREEVGAHVGPYRLLQELGEGGMGTVFLAEQQHPVARRVALKIIKAGMDSRQVLARFEAEEQALALMDHPNIAKVFDAGVTQAGRPYFVMELVRGIPITQYCDQEHLTPRERLELFIPVCQAVQHAHQKGIIHRDIKPSNVIVGLCDGKPVPKVIDFGVAKATGAKLTERTMYTEVGQIVGTLEYMAPEQAELNNLDIDTRVDIYSLGVLLYELLTGSPPFSGRELRSAAFDEMLRIIREVEPPKPSTKLSHADELPTIAAKRKLEPQRLTRLVSGELDCIVMRCLEKERARRYDTATAVAADIEHYLHDEPVVAGPPSRMYRLRKLVRRNRGAIVLACVVAACLLVGLCATSWQAIRATRAESLAQARYEGERTARSEAEAERSRATEQSKRADTEAETAKQQEKKARTEAAVAQAVRDFLQNKLLGQADAVTQANALLQSGQSATDAKPDPTIRELLDRTVPELAPGKIDENFPQQFLVQAEILATVGNTYRRLGKYEVAIESLERAVALRKEHGVPDDRDTLLAIDQLAMAYREAGRLPEAIETSRQAAAAMVAKLGNRDRSTLQSLEHLAVACWAQGNRSEALQLWKQVQADAEMALGADDLDTLVTTNSLACAYMDVGNVPEAIGLLANACEKMTIRRGPNHPETLVLLSNLACAYLAGGQCTEAIQRLEEVRRAEESMYGPHDPRTLITLNDLAAAYWSAKQLDKSVPLFEKLLTELDAQLGRQHPLTLQVVANLGVNYKDAGRLEEPLPLLEEAYRASEKYPLLGFVGPQLLDCYVRAGKSTEASRLVKELLARLRRSLPEDSPELAGQLAQFASILLKLRMFSDAEGILRECLAVRETSQPDDWRTFNTKNVLGGALVGQANQLQSTDAAAAAAKFTEAEPLLVRGYEGMQQRADRIPTDGKVRLTEALQRLVDLYTAWGKPAEASKWQQKLDEAMAAEPRTAESMRDEAKTEERAKVEQPTEEEGERPVKELP